MAFHLGVLKRMAERDLFGRVRRISTVSGGSLLIGLLLKECEMRWPTSEEFRLEIYPRLRDKLCSRSLQWGAARQLLNPLNWRFLLSRANLLARALRKEWGINNPMSDLPEVPEWSINGTTAENGRRFRFKRNDMGDYALGYAASANFPLANALAVSAAFPGGFGPLKFAADKHVWRKRKWDAPLGSEIAIDIGHDSLHLYDGGIYDNLGLEPFFDSGRGEPKQSVRYIVVSDAGSPLPSGFPSHSLSPWRLKRVLDIVSDQAHALRIRTFVHYLQRESNRGALIFMNTPTTSGDEDALFASTFPTTLRRLTLSEFDRLAGHGYRVTTHVERTTGWLEHVKAT